MKIAEIIADGEELCAAIVDVEPDRAPDILVNAALVGYARQHLATLLAVARAAVALDFDGAHCMNADIDHECYEFSPAEILQLRAAVRGEGKEREG